MALPADTFQNLADHSVSTAEAKFWPSFGLRELGDGLLDLVKTEKGLSGLRQKLIQLGASKRLPKEGIYELEAIFSYLFMGW